ncbi:hypothetical protein GJ496_008773 [Pomphorhynchus laevis]|nr:hypothetical protein GJ496_006521 [Pomphorhynchus laevis]KAI0979606.1 hypothetical protein GJ496_008773 [Pomphorhynchus laevis]
MFRTIVSSFLVALCLLVHESKEEPFVITIDAHSEDCYYDILNTGDLFALTYEVIDGGFLDVHVSVHSPDGKEIFKQEKENSGQFMFPVHLDGMYKVCFSNKVNSRTPKTIMFTVDNPRAQLHHIDTNANFTSDQIKLKDMIGDLVMRLTAIKNEQNYVENRQKVHRSLSDSTSRKVVLWAIFESSLMIGMTIGQVYYLMRFFEVRRIV